MCPVCKPLTIVGELQNLRSAIVVDVPHWTKLAGSWVLAALIAVAFSWGAVAQVRNRVIQPTIEIPTTSLGAAPTQSPERTTASTGPTVIHLEPELVNGEESPTTTLVEPGEESTTTTSFGQSNTATSASSVPTSEPQTATTSTTMTTVPAGTLTSSYQLVGGVVTISYAPGIVIFVSAIPQTGYSTDLRETGLDRVWVRFDGNNHTSDFRAEREGGELKITTSESGES